MIAWETEKRIRLSHLVESYFNNPLQSQSDLPVPVKLTSEKSEYIEFVDEFCENSSIHGVKYMGDRKRQRVERLWWLIAFLLSIYGCTMIILNAWQRWDSNPVIVSFSEQATPVWQIPFPAVTICFETRSVQQSFRCNGRRISALSRKEVS